MHVPFTGYSLPGTQPSRQRIEMIEMMRMSIFNASGKHRIASFLLIFFVLFGIGLAVQGPWWAGLFCLPFVFLTLEKMYVNRPEEER